MGLSYADAVQLGIAYLHPAHPRPEEPERPRAISRTADDGLNKTERRFAEMLRATPGVHWWLPQAVKLRLAGRTWYTPDFLVSVEATLTFCEIKGFLRDDAAVKVKVAAGQYPQFRWLLIRRGHRGWWDVREVNSYGIGTAPIHVPWIRES